MELRGGILQRQQILLRYSRQAQRPIPKHNGNEKITGKTALRKLRLNKNVKVIINDTDKNVGPACADKTEVIEEC